MKKEKIYKMLDEMTLPDAFMDMLDTPKWRFWKKDEYLNEDDLFSYLPEFIEQRSGKGNIQIRENAYNVLSKLLRRTMRPEYCQYLIDRLTKETNKNMLREILFSLSLMQLPADLDASAIALCSRHDASLVRQIALDVLRQCNTDISRNAVRYWVCQEDEKQYKFELIYANAALGYIGEVCDIPLLEKHIHSRIRDVKGTASYAIDNIQQRFDLTNPSPKK